jgi:RNA polymerase sigma factor (sigma-70 family)
MTNGQVNQALEHVGRALLRQDGGGLTDAQLLTSFVECRDEAAFEALVRRHGPLVLGVCRRVLGHAQDAEDAFQAAFLVLARRASSVVPRAMLANWLHGVAYRTALRARAVAGRRRVRERQVEHMPEPEAPPALPDDLLALLDGELSALPDHYRAPVLLCDLEGRTRQEAARQLGCPEGTLHSRLARGRALLAGRLARRGVTLSAGALAVLAPRAAPAALIASTLRAAAGAAPAPVAALAEGVLKAMFLTRLKSATALLLACAALAGGVTVFARPGQAPATAAHIAEPTAVRRSERHREAAPLRKAADLVRPLAPAPLPREDRAPTEEQVDLWLKLLQSEKRDVRIQAASALGEMGPRARKAVPALIRVARHDNDKAVRRAAVEGLGGIGPQAKEAVVLLVELLLDEEDDLAYFAAEALGGLGKEARLAVPALTRALRSRYTSVTYGAARALGKIGPPARAAVPELLRHRRNVTDCIRAEVAVALWRVEKHPQAIPMLIEHLRDPSACDRGSAALCLAELGPDAKAAVPALLAALDDNQHLVNVRSAYALWKIARHKDAIPTLIRLLEKGRDGTTRAHAADWLGMIGPDARAAVPALKRARKDTGHWVAASAEAALNRIDRPGKGKAP